MTHIAELKLNFSRTKVGVDEIFEFVGFKMFSRK